MNRKLELDLASLEVESFDTSGLPGLNGSGTVQAHTYDTFQADCFGTAQVNCTGDGVCYSNDPGAYTICAVAGDCGGDGGTHLALGCGGGGGGSGVQCTGLECGATMDPGSVYCYSYASPCPETRDPGGCTNMCPV